MKQEQETVIVLPDIRSVYNVGSIFRTADAAGVAKIYLAGYSPTPLDRFGRPRKDLHKSALGAEESVAWEYVSQADELITRLRGEGYMVAAVEQDASSIGYRELPQSGKLALVFGNEVDGVDSSILQQCNMIAEIPMCGRKESLNVAVSVGIILFRL